MRVTSIADFHTAPGQYLEWPVVMRAGTASSVPPSFNQSFHLSSALEPAVGSGTDTASVWIAVAFDVDGPIDIDALTSAFGTFVRRHPALRTSFAARDGVVARRVYEPDEVDVMTPTSVIVDGSAALTAHIRARFDVLCHPARIPSYSLAAVSRTSRSTVVCGFDHAHVDAVSMTVAAEEISHLYAAHRVQDAAALPEVGSFVDFCATEIAAPVVDLTDPRLQAWANFFASCGNRTPEFPFDLGVPSGTRAPQATTVHRLADAAEAAAFEQACRDLGGGSFAAVAAAMAQASADIGGPSTLPLLFPLHTRREARYEQAIGWFTTNAPMNVEVFETFAGTLASAQSSFRDALALGTVPIPRVLEAVGDTLTRGRGDVFMISYVDYRRLPGADATGRNAHHISNVTTADDAQFWVSRTQDGLALRSRFPDTTQAHIVIERFVRALQSVVRAAASDPVDTSDLLLLGPSA